MVRKIATLYLTCGLPCAGKTTLAREIEESRGAVRLTPDDWLTRLLGTDRVLGEIDERRGAMESLLWDVAARLLSLGVDVVLDFGVWSRDEREEFRGRAAALGARSELHFVDAPLDVLIERVRARNATMPPGALRIDEGEMELWATWFEPPEAAELEPREPTP